MTNLISRRNVMLGLGGTAAVGAATVGSGGADFFAQALSPGSAGRSNVPLHSAEFEDWSTHVGSNFTAHSGQVLKLVDVQAFPQRSARPGDLRERAFVARFDISRGAALAEELYRVAHPNGGTFDMFLTNGGPDKPLRMLAVFN